MRRAVTTGCEELDILLGGGLFFGEAVLVYGEAETGKTTLAIQCAVNAARMGFKTLYVDSDNAFNPIRLTQIAEIDRDEVASSIMVFNPQGFEEQSDVIDHLHVYLTGNTKLLIVDTITTLYRLEMGDKEETFLLNRELNRQLAFIVEVTRRKRIATFLTSQVRSIVDDGMEEESPIEPVGTRVLKFWADKILRLERTARNSVIKVSLEKPTNTKGPLQAYLKISSEGIKDWRRNALQSSDWRL